MSIRSQRNDGGSNLGVNMSADHKVCDIPKAWVHVAANYMRGHSADLRPEFNPRNPPRPDSIHRFRTERFLKPRIEKLFHGEVHDWIHEIHSSNPWGRYDISSPIDSSRFSSILREVFTPCRTSRYDNSHPAGRVRSSFFSREPQFAVSRFETQSNAAIGV